MENTGRKTPSLVETEEEECFLEPWTVVSIMSLSSDDEMSDEEPSTVETVEKYPKETLNGIPQRQFLSRWVKWKI